MKEQLTAESYRAKRRVSIDAMSNKIDEHYRAFYEVAKFASENDIDATRIETPYGDYTIVFTKPLKL